MARADDIGEEAQLQRTAIAGDEPAIPAWKLEAQSAIANLRHASILQADDVDRWLNAMHEREPDRLLWHIRRTDGVSASSVQTYIDEMKGKYPRFEAARELDLQRLYRVTPSEPNHHMRRGTLLENVNRHVFHEMFNLRTAEPELARIAAQRGIKQAPSLVGNPDDLVTLRTGPAALIMPDYKVPAKRKEVDVEVFPHYVAQLHQYALLAHGAKVKIQKLVLSNLYLEPDFAADLVAAIGDTAEGSQQRADLERESADRIVWMLRRFAQPKSVDFTPIEIAFDYEVAKDIVRAANLADARVQRGEAAPWPKRDPLPISRESTSNLQTYAEIFIRLNQLAQQSAALAGKVGLEIRGSLKQELGDAPVEKKKTPFPGLSVYTQASLDEIDAINFLRASGCPTADLFERKIDARKAQQIALELGAQPTDLLAEPPLRSGAKELIRQRLESAGAPAGRFESHALVIKMSPAKKGPGAERIAIARESAYQTLEGVMRDAGVQSDMSVEEMLTTPSIYDDSGTSFDDDSDGPSMG